MSSPRMYARVGEVLRPGLAFHDEYDFGSTTELKLRVAGMRDGQIGRRPLRLLARNDPAAWQCAASEDDISSLEEVLCNPELVVIRRVRGHALEERLKRLSLTRRVPATSTRSPRRAAAPDTAAPSRPRTLSGERSTGGRSS